MTNAKECIKNNILVAMRSHIDVNTMQILENVINKTLFALDMSERQQDGRE